MQMKPLGPIDTTPLFPALRQKLIDLLRGLSPDDWQRDTICAGWSVKDIVSHILDTALRTVAMYRDSYFSSDKPIIESYRDLVDYLNQLNNDWVRATRRLSPALLVDWLEQAGREADEQLMALPPNESAVFSVAWAGQMESPNWFHVARDYTERWHHQQQIRLAVGQEEGILSDELYQPVLDTFMRALPYAYREVRAVDGTLLQVSLTDMADGNWFLHRQNGSWVLIEASQGQQPDTLVTINRNAAWQLFTRNLPEDQAISYVHSQGDEHLGRCILRMRSVMM